MTDARRPLQTTPLGVPDFGWLSARSQAALVLVANKKWITIPTVVLTAVNPVYQIVGSIPMLATTTGRFRGRLTGYPLNTAGAPHLLFGAMSHGTGILVPDYAQIALQLPANVSETGGNGTVALTIDFPANGFTAAVGSTTAINALFGVDVASVIAIGTNAIQFEVEEY